MPAPAAGPAFALDSCSRTARVGYIAPSDPVRSRHIRTTTLAARNPDEEEAAASCPRVREPLTQGGRSVRERGIEQRREAHDPASVGGGVEDREERNDACHRQAEPLPREPRAEANLDVETSQRL